jgi:hypothetical protein
MSLQSSISHSPPRHNDPSRSTLTIEDIGEEEARRRREQLNRRPSYRMILKDLETVGDKPMKKEVDEASNGDRQPQQQPQGGAHPLGSLSNSVNLNSPYGSPASTAHMNGVASAPIRTSVTATSAAPVVSIGSPPRLNMLPPSRGGNEIPSQPQPQLNPSALLQSAANAALVLPVTGDLLSLKPVNEPISLSTAGGFNPGNGWDWQSTLLSSYNTNHSPLTGGTSLGNRQASASLTSLSDNDNNDSNRKRQVRLLKNREAAKECRRKKKEYVKCLENRVAVLENQNKALIEELKTLKELYCRKEKTEH